MKKSLLSTVLGTFFAASFAVAPGFAQSSYPQQPPPPAPDQQQPYPQQQYPQTQQYPQQQPPPQGQYPPPQGQYPPPQGQYPPPQGQYPPQQYPPGQYGQQPPMMAPQQLDQLVGPVALYPDSLLAQVLTAATFYNEIPEAATWANQHSYMHGEQLAQAIQQDQLPWDASVIALLPFPQVLDYMARNPGWTQQLGNAVLVQRGDVMDAVQRDRQIAYNNHYLQSNQYESVNYAGPGDIEIMPVSPGYYYVPYYDPIVVFGRPRPGFFVGGAIRFGPGITLGAAFAPWGWGGVGLGFGWRSHEILIDNRPWGRTWVNRGAYVHPYVAARPYHAAPGRYVEHHDVRAREEHHDRR
jgi:hypothetical protein